jgi:hypothetical protein
VSPSVLLSADPEPDGSVDQAGGLRAALARYDLASSGRGRPSAGPVGEVGRRVEHAWLTYQHAHYPQLLRMLPDLLGDAQRAQAAGGPGPGAGPAALLGQVYRIAASVLVKVGEAELAWLAADRAVAVTAGDPLGSAVAAVPLGWALRASGGGRLAMAATVEAAHRLAPLVPHDARPGELSVCGTLLIQAGLAAATCGDASGAEGLVGQAAQIAERVGAGHDHEWTGFGPAAVESARVAVAVALGEGREAVRRHQDSAGRQVWRGLPVEHRAAHLLDVARGHLQIGDLAGAGRVVIEADRIAPAEIRSRPLARTVVAELVHDGPVPADVARLATALGVV